MKELTHIEEGSVNLQSLGVAARHHGKRPTKSAYPPRFNPDARKIWDKMMASKEFLGMMGALGTPESQWRMALSEFMKRARNANVVAVQDTSGASANKRIENYLGNGRRKLVAALDKTGLLSTARLMKPHRLVAQRNSGFLITSSAELKVPTLSAYGDLVKQLSGHGFTMPRGGSLQRQVCPGVRVQLNRRPTLSYTVEVHQDPVIRVRGNGVVSKKQFLSFVERRLWLPVVRANRFKTLKNPKSLF